MTTFQIVRRGLGFVLFAGLTVGCGGSSTSDGTNSGGNSGTGASSSGGHAGSGGATGGSGGATGGSGGVAGGSGGDAGVCGPDAKTCAQPSDCTLVAASCCLCSLPQLSDYVAANTAHAAECSCQGPACGCATQLNPNLTAVCSSGTCTGLDVTQSDYSACQLDTDCTLRIGLNCCESCQSTGYDLVAVNMNQTALRDALCGSGSVGCPGCVPQYPADKKAVCVANHCQVQ